MLEWLVPIIVDNVIGYILDQSGLGDKIRSKYERKPVRGAFQHSLEKTFAYFESQYPQLAAEGLFKQSFQDPRSTTILAQLLLRDGHPDPQALAKLWADTLYKYAPEKHAIVQQKFEIIANKFLNYLNSNLRTESALQDILDRQALERTASSAETMSSDIHDLRDFFIPTKINAVDLSNLRHQYCEKLFEQWKMLDFKGIQHTDLNRPVSIPLTEVFILPDVLVGVPEYETIERDEIEKQDRYKKEKQERNREDDQERLTRQDRRHPKGKQIIVQREDFRIVLGKHRRLVVLGDPGSGKTTLLRYLMLT